MALQEAVHAVRDLAEVVEHRLTLEKGRSLVARKDVQNPPVTESSSCEIFVPMAELGVRVLVAVQPSILSWSGLEFVA